AAQRVHAQAGIVGERRQAAGGAGVAGLEERVLDERMPGFLGIGDAERALGHQREAAAGEQRAEFRQLAGVAAGEDQPPAHSPASARRWAWTSSATPFSASASMASSSSRRNACPSAVPCNSMKAPPSFITTFMSVSQAASSA